MAALMRMKLENDELETRYSELDMKHNAFMANYSAVVVDKHLHDEAVMKKASKGYDEKLQKLETKLTRKETQLNENILQLQKKVLKWRTKCDELTEEKRIAQASVEKGFWHMMNAMKDNHTMNIPKENDLSEKNITNHNKKTYNPPNTTAPTTLKKNPPKLAKQDVGVAIASKSWLMSKISASE
eukprot:CAMPEP_0171303594 /NCGR_PEP_ID=MMETSP0816-20121228/13131_1 /TAXON_ID=420281 /ORGANISM="Proboscia inermis, Strain CCAP1064/1" /LENGTH=183 /DNA_ID=CAMNT_0011782953 /DNA_START=1 /DNA_END=553 /DNA_ORIENTATION=-